MIETTLFKVSQTSFSNLTIKFRQNVESPSDKLRIREKYLAKLPFKTNSIVIQKSYKLLYQRRHFETKMCF